LVTGGAGFIGSNIVARLVEMGESPRVIDNFATGRRENLEGLLAAIDLVEGDIRSLDACREACDGIDYVIHQAAIPSVPRSVEDPILSNEANVTGTLNVLLAARDAGVRRVVIASSSSVYGANPKLPKHESMTPAPISPYAASKLATEAYAGAFASVYDLETVCLRYFNVFGPRQDPKSQYAAVIPLFTELVLRGDAPTVFGDGEQSRDFTFVANVVDANLLATTAEGASGRVFNIACGACTTLNELLQHVNEILGTGIAAQYTAPRAGDVKHSLADIGAASEILGYEPKVAFRDGLERTIEWYKNGSA
jgi:nucleoside-diphosphate-sugar epimerase